MYARSVTYQARHRLVKTVHVSRIAVWAAVTSLLFAITGVLFFAPSASTAGVPTYDHVVVAIMENHDYSSVIGAPYISGLAGQGASMTDSHAIGHPSEPNYLELWSGSNQGVTDDSCPHTFTTPSLGTQMQAASRSIATYSESMPSDGYLGCSSGSYARKHNPAANWVATQGVTNNKTFGAFPSFASLPAVSLVVPNLCNDMHDCSVATGDTWLKNNMDAYVQWAKANNSLFILTWDENSGTSGNQIATIFVGAGIVPGQYSEFINHYNVLHTIEATQGLPPIGVDATVITDIFGITSPTTTTTTPTTTTTTTTTTTPPPVVGSLRGIFTYPWFPGGWNQQGLNPFTHYHPTAGLYSSVDPALAAYHVAMMRYARQNFGIDSWWGQGSREDVAFPTDLAAATGTGFKWTVYYEPEGIGDPSVAQLQSDLTYIKNMYAGSSNWLHINGQPVIFVFTQGTDGCSMATRWKQANATEGFYVNLKVFGGYTGCADQPDNWHQYGPASATDQQGTHSFSISPGFFKANETTPRLVRDLTRWESNITSMVNSNADFELVTTLNEWGEGTSVEPASEWIQGGVFGSYIAALHDLIP